MRNGLASQAQIFPEISGDLVNWQCGPDPLASVSVAPRSGGLERWTLQDAGVAPASPRFLRLRITLFP
jgi:hypothetical protein